MTTPAEELRELASKYFEGMTVIDRRYQMPVDDVDALFREFERLLLAQQQTLLDRIEDIFDPNGFVATDDLIDGQGVSNGIQRRKILQLREEFQRIKGELGEV